MMRYQSIVSCTHNPGVLLCSNQLVKPSNRIACEVLGVKEGSYYKWRATQRQSELEDPNKSDTAQLDQAVTKRLLLDRRVAKLFEKHDGKRGYRTIAAELRIDAGALCEVQPPPLLSTLDYGDKVVRASMTRQYLSAKQTRRYRPQTTDRTEEADKKQNLLLHNCGKLSSLPFELDHSILSPQHLKMLNDINAEPFRLRASQPHQVQVSDITYIRMVDSLNHWGYLCSWQDQFTRRIVGWSVGYHQTAEMVNRATEQALLSVDPTLYPLISHSDGGSQYVSKLIGDRLERSGAHQSITRRGCTLDNAQAESLWSRLKVELELTGSPIKARWFDSLEEAQQVLERYIDYYNHERPHSGIGYKTPVAYEEQWKKENVLLSRPRLVLVPASLRSAGTSTKPTPNSSS